MPDKSYAFNVRLAIQTIIAIATSSLRQQPLLFVIPNGFHRKAIHSVDPNAQLITEPPTRSVQVTSSATSVQLEAALRQAGKKAWVALRCSNQCDSRARTLNWESAPCGVITIVGLRYENRSGGAINSPTG